MSRNENLDKQEIEQNELLDHAIDGALYRTHTAMIAQVVSFDADRNTVDVQPVLMRKMVGYGARPLPVIKSVPVAYYGAGGYCITFTPAKGDYCQLWVNERSLDRWKQTGGIVDPAKRRRHDMTDAVAYFGLNDYGNAYQSIGAGLDLRTRDGTTSVHIEAGQITVTVGGTIIATMTGSDITFNVPVSGPSGTFGGVVVETHTHSGVQSGASNTGGPN